MVALLLHAALLSAQPQDLKVGDQNAHVEVANSLALTPPNGLTVETWARYNPNLAWGTSYPTLVYHHAIGGHPYILRVISASAIVQFGIWTQNGYVGFDSTTPIQSFGWSHVAATWDGQIMRLYIDGNPAGTMAHTGTMRTSTEMLSIGRGGGSSSETWKGRMDEVRIWDHARTQAEIIESMFDQIDLAPGLVAAWHFNGSFDDETGGHDGVPFGAAQLASSTSPVNPLQLVVPGRSVVGVALPLHMRGMPANAPYFLDNSFVGSAIGMPLVAPLTGTFPLDPPLLNLTYGAMVPGIFVDYLGFADAAGTADATFNVPDWQHLIGMQMSSGFLYLDNLSPMVLGAIAPVVRTIFLGPAPVISAVLPSSGPVSGNWNVAIQGQNFDPNSQIWFGTQQASAVTVHSTGFMTCKTPPAATTGSVDVKIVDPIEDPALAPAAFTYVADLVVTSLNPIFAATGTSVTITGTGIQPGATVTVAGVLAPVTLQNSTQIVFTMPPGSFCQAPVVVWNPDGQQAALPINPGPFISGTVGAVGPAAGGGLFYVLGGNFEPGLQVTVGAVAAVVTSASLNVVSVLAPPGPVGTATVTLTNPSGCSATTTYQYQ